MTIVNTIYLNGCNYQFGYDLLSQDIASNSSTVRFYGVLNVTNNYVGWSSGSAWAHTASSSLYNYYSKGSYTVTQGDFTYTHNSDGNLTLNAGFGISTTFVSGESNAIFSLPKINRVAVTNNVVGRDIEGDFQVNYTKYVDSYSYRLIISIPNVQGLETLSYNISGTTVNLTAETLNTLYNYMTSNKVSLGFRIETWDGDTKLSFGNEIVVECYLYNAEPTYDVAYLDTNSTTTAITNNNQQLIRNNSTLQVNFTNMEAKKEATLSSAYIVIDGTTYNGTISGTTCTINVGVLNLSSNVNASVVVTDSRNISTTQTLALEILDWQLPTGLISLERQSNYYSETDINVDANYSSLDSKNEITIKVRYKKETDSSYSSYVNLQDNVTSTLTLDNLYTWDVQVLIEDLLGSTTYNQSLGIGLPIFFIDRNLRSVGIECFPNDSESLEVAGKNVITEIENLQTYSTSETNTGKIWIDGKPIYRQVFEYGQLPNATSLGVNHNIPIDTPISCLGIVYRSSSPANTWTLPTSNIFIDLDMSQVYITTTSDRTDLTCKAIIEYTKTTD